MNTDFNDYTKIKGIKYFNWVKRIKQAHLAGPEHTTMCDMPMLGSNYARDFEQRHWNRCEECYNKAQKVKLDDAGKLKAIKHLLEEDVFDHLEEHNYLEPDLTYFAFRLRDLINDIPVKIPSHLPNCEELK